MTAEQFADIQACLHVITGVLCMFLFWGVLKVAYRFFNIFF